MMKKIAILLAAVVFFAGCSPHKDSTAAQNESSPPPSKAADEHAESKQKTESISEKEGPSESPDSIDNSSSTKSSDTATAEPPEDENRKSPEQIDQENSLDSNVADADIKTPEEFLRLPIWEIEREAMKRLEAASQSKTIKQIEQELQQARGFFASLEKNLAKLNINENEKVQKLYNMQKKVVTAYTQHIDTYLRTSDPSALKSLQEADQAFIDFIKTAKKVVADNE